MLLHPGTCNNILHDQRSQDSHSSDKRDRALDIVRTRRPHRSGLRDRIVSLVGLSRNGVRGDSVRRRNRLLGRLAGFADRLSDLGDGLSDSAHLGRGNGQGSRSVAGLHGLHPVVHNPDGVVIVEDVFLHGVADLGRFAAPGVRLGGARGGGFSAVTLDGEVGGLGVDDVRVRAVDGVELETGADCQNGGCR
jgi:hypothetical protein